MALALAYAAGRHRRRHHGGARAGPARPGAVHADPRPAQPPASGVTNIGQSGALSTVPRAARRPADCRRGAPPAAGRRRSARPAPQQLEFGTPGRSRCGDSPVRSGQTSWACWRLHTPQIVRRDLLVHARPAGSRWRQRSKCRIHGYVAPPAQRDRRAARVCCRVSSSQTLDEIPDLVVKTVHDIFHCKAAGVALRSDETWS